VVAFEEEVVGKVCEIALDCAVPESALRALITLVIAPGLAEIASKTLAAFLATRLPDELTEELKAELELLELLEPPATVKSQVVPELIAKDQVYVVPETVLLPEVADKFEEAKPLRTDV
jgi:hypothetical protein